KPLLESIQAKTSFEALTGRARGTEAKAVMRKGAVGEWREALLPDEQERAWRLAGDQLRAFGYTRHGTRRGLPDLSKIEEQPYRFQRTLELEEQVAALRTAVCRLESRLMEEDAVAATLDAADSISALCCAQSRQASCPGPCLDHCHRYFCLQ